MEISNERDLYIKIENALYESGLSLKKFGIGQKKEKAICMFLNKTKDKNIWSIFTYEQKRKFDEVIIYDNEEAFNYFAYKITFSSCDKEKVKNILFNSYLNDQINQIYFIINEHMNQTVESFGYYNTSRRYEIFLKNYILNKIDMELSNLDFEYKNLDIQYMNIVNQYKFTFNNLLERLKDSKNNLKLFVTIISLIELVYFLYLEDNKNYKLIKQNLKNNEFDEYKLEKFGSMKNYINNKLTLR